MRRIVAAFGFGLLACAGPGGEPVTLPGPPPPSPPPANPTYDVDLLGIPRFVANNYIDLSPIAQISTFRSSVGHDYHDDFEGCRSMKHYFQPRAAVDWSTIPIYAPVTGTVAVTRADSYGLQVVIRAATLPAFSFILFHVNPTIPVAAGTPVTAGQQLGRHIGSQTLSDIAVGVDTPSGFKLLSWFDVMTDGLFAAYAGRGVPSRTSMIISRPARDADPLTCAGETFTTVGTLASWLLLN